MVTRLLGSGYDSAKRLPPLTDTQMIKYLRNLLGRAFGRGPRWRHHGCHRCVFLGRHKDRGLGPVDLYYCPQTAVPTLMARHGDEPDQYSSGLVGSAPWQTEGRRRAIALGLSLSPRIPKTVSARYRR